MCRMLWVGLSGGIGSGKSTVARRLAEHGAVLIDADVLAREVVEPGTEGLAELVRLFGEEILDEQGRLDRPAMARRVFGDDHARAQLNSVVHPRIATRTAERVAEAPEDAVVVHDIPLLVEAGYAAGYHLVLIVDADEEFRVHRLVDRGLEESDARARIRAQASRQQRVEAADVWLDNSGSVAELTDQVDRLWTERLAAFEATLRKRRAADVDPGAAVEHDPDWPNQAARLAARLRKAAGERGLSVEHIGPTAVPGLPARNVLDLQITVTSLDDADALAGSLANAGFPLVPDSRSDVQHSDDPAQWEKRLHATADPGRPATVHLRVAGRANRHRALLFRDWLSADAEAREECAQRIVDAENPAAAEDSWFAEAYPRAQRWAADSGWIPED